MDPTLERGLLVAKILRGAWRANPPAPDFTEAELARALPQLVSTYTAALAWWRIRHSPLAHTQIGATLRARYVTQSVLAAEGTYRVYQYVSALKREHIEPIVFKGWALFSYYAEPGLRSMGDVDLAVAPDEQARATKILRDMGATAVDVDVHGGVEDPAHKAYIPGATWDDLLRRSRNSSIGPLQVRVLGSEDELQLVCIHCMRHFGSRPNWFCDIAAILETRFTNFDWTRVLATPPYTSWIVYAMLLTQRLLDANLENTPLALHRSPLPDWLVVHVLAQWMAQGVAKPQVYPSLSQVWRSPAKWRQAARVRVPDLLESTLNYHGGLDEPLLARYQLRALWERWSKFAGRRRD